MNLVEKFLMNNPIRYYIQRHIEAPILLKLGGKTEAMNVLEIGCGSGNGTKIILEMFGAGHVTAIDLDPFMVKRAKKMLEKNFSGKVKVEFGDISSLSFDANQFDAVFDFAVIHHIEDWEQTISQIARVIKKGGKFYFEEVSKKGLNGWFLRTFTRHPLQNRFSHEDFCEQLRKNNFGDIRIELKKEGNYFFGVARKY